MKNWRLIVALAVAFLALGGVATWDEWQTKKDEAADKLKNKIVDFSADDVVELDYASKGVTKGPEAEGAETADDEPKAEGEVRVTAVKKDGVWRLTKPVDSLADVMSIDGVVKTIVDYASVKEVTTARERWGEYGLLDPERTITLRTGGDKPQEFSIFIGDKGPIGYNVYFRTSKDDKVYIGSQHLLVSTSKTLFDFRDKTLVTIDENKLKTLTYLRRDHAPIEVVKNDGKYAITKPEPLEADAGEMKQFVDELNLLRVSEFIDQPDAELVAAFAAPYCTVRWQGETGEESTLKLVDRGGKLYAAFDPQQRIFGLPEDFKAKVEKELTDFRNRRILSSDALAVQAVEIDGTPYKAVQGNWYLESDAAKFDDAGKLKDENDKPQEQAHIRAFVVDLEFAKTDRFFAMDDPAAKALNGPPEHRITLRYADAAKKPLVIDLFKPVGEPSDDKYMVKRSDAELVYRVPRTAFASMTPAKDAPETGGTDASATPVDDGDVPHEEDDSQEGLNLEDPSESSGLHAPSTTPTAG